MRLRLTAAMVFAIAATACRSTGGAAPPPAGAPVSAATPAEVPLEQRMPAQAGAYRLTERQTLADGGGFLIRYRDTSAVWITVFLYPPDPDAMRQHSDPAALVRYEGEKFQQVMEIQTQRGLYSSSRNLVSRPDTLRTSRGPVAGHMSAVSVVMGGRPITEQQHLYLLGSTFVKLRTSVPATAGTRTDLYAAIEAIVDSLRGSN